MIWKQFFGMLLLFAVVCGSMALLVSISAGLPSSHSNVFRFAIEVGWLEAALIRSKRPLLWAPPFPAFRSSRILPHRPTSLFHRRCSTHSTKRGEATTAAAGLGIGCERDRAHAGFRQHETHVVGGLMSPARYAATERTCS